MTRTDELIAEVMRSLDMHQLDSESVEQALRQVYDGARRHAHGCSSEDCTRPGHDYARVTFSTPTGSMQGEVLFCELHLATLEMYNHGRYMLLRRKASL